MQTVTTAFNNGILSPVRTVKAKVELNGSTTTFTHNDRIKTIEIQRVAEANKFFGMCIMQRLNIHLIDVDRELSITTANDIKPSFGIGNDYVGFPKFYVTEVNRDENTNELSVTAYDLMHKVEEYTVADLSLVPPYTIEQFASAVAALVNTTVVKIGIASGESCFSTSYADGANFDGTENLKDALCWVAEVTQTICYIDALGRICFKRLPASSSLSITRNHYITCKNNGNHRLQTICSATELGDNVSASTSQVGSTQYVRNNPFWELRDDVGALVQDAIDAVGNTTIGVFELSWRGHPALELGDKITITAKDGTTFYSYLLDDVISYNGVFSEKSKWDYQTDESETESNPSTIGEKINQTFARVDKVNKQISLVAGNIEDISSSIAELQLTTNSIEASVTEMSESVSEDIAALTERVSASMTAEDVQLAISRTLEDGVSSVTTTTGFTFNEEGLTVSKSDSDISTQITENGLHVRQNSTEVLIANDDGVDARNLHANTYLIIGQNSRLEDFNGRTACFWLGGNS